MDSVRRLLPAALIAALSTLACGQEFASMQDDATDGAGGSSAASMGGSAAAGKSMGVAGSGGTGAAGDGATGGEPPVEGEAGAGNMVVGTSTIPLEGLELWLRADEGISQVGGAVSVWRDGSPHGRDALQIESANRPKLVDGALAGKQALVFDGVDDFFALPELDADISQGVSMFIAFQQEAIGMCGAWFEASNGRELQELHFGDWQNSVIYEIAESWINDTSFPLLMAQPQVTGAIHGTDKMVALRTNGSSAGQGAVTLSPPNLTRKYVYVGKTLYTDCTYFKGSIGEILLYSRAVSAAEMLEIESYLQAKWACCGG